MYVTLIKKKKTLNMLFDNFAQSIVKTFTWNFIFITLNYEENKYSYAKYVKVDFYNGTTKRTIL